MQSGCDRAAVGNVTKSGKEAGLGQSKWNRVVMAVVVALSAVQIVRAAGYTHTYNIKNPRAGTKATSVHVLDLGGNVIATEGLVRTFPGSSGSTVLMSKGTIGVAIPTPAGNKNSLQLVKDPTKNGQRDILGGEKVTLKFNVSGSSAPSIDDLYFDYNNSPNDVSPAIRANNMPAGMFSEVAPNSFEWSAFNDSAVTVRLTDFSVFTDQDPSMLDIHNTSGPIGDPIATMPPVDLLPGERVVLSFSGFDESLPIFGQYSSVVVGNPSDVLYHSVAQIVPEPGSLVLFALGGLGALRRRA